MTLAQIENRSERHTVAEGIYRDAGITVQRRGENIGAQVGGVRLGGDVSTEQVEAIRLALALNKVIAFTGQDHLDDDSQYAFAQLLGDPTGPHPTVTSRGERLLTIEGAANSWHTDVSFVDRIPKASLLRPITLPTWGGATTFASTVAAYEQLPAPLRAFVDGLWAKHTNLYDYATATQHNGSGDAEHRAEHYKEFTSTEYQTLHPVVRVHPQTGERSLLLGHFVSEFPALKPAEFQAVFQLLQSRITRLENTFRWNWTPGDLVIWDNRATQHYGIADFGNQQRQLHRVTLAGDVPVDIHGEHSRILKGDAAHYSSLDQPQLLGVYAA